MKTNKYQRRFYRDWVKTEDLYLSRVIVKETDLQILTDKPADEDYIKERVNKYRWDIENYISKDKRFFTSLKPIEVELRAPLIVRKMAQAAKAVNVGPMAAVAGAIAQSLGRDLLKKGFEEVIIENGGDIFLKAKKIRGIGIYAGRLKLWKGLGLKINPADTPIGICASSGTIGHSLSFGNAESVVILSKNVFLADAAATAVSNRVKSKNDLNMALDFARCVKGVSGVVIIFKNALASWGKVEFIR